MLNDLDAVRRLCAPLDVDVCVDAISSLGSVPCDFSGLAFASAVSGKALGAYPGIALVFHRDPAAQARAFAAQGFEYLHVVDLDGAFAGKPVNAAAVERIVEAVAIPVQLGGGIRDLATIEGWLGKGVTRVIIGTAAVRDPELVKHAARKFPTRRPPAPSAA